MLCKVIFKKLFGQFDYEINLTNEYNTMIITGPNGFGKSTILNSIYALYSNDIIFFSELNFEKILFYSENYKKPLTIEKNKDGVFVNKTKINVDTFWKEIRDIAREKYSFRKDYSEDENVYWVENETNKVISKYEMFRLVIQNDCIEEEINNKDFVEIIKKFKKYSHETKFIKEQRLLKQEIIIGNFRGKKIKTTNVIDDLSEEVIKKINSIMNEFSLKSNELDSTYVKRLFETKKGITKEEYDDYLKNMEVKFDKLKKYNIILDTIKLKNQTKFLEEHAKALKVYFDDFEKKYKVFEEFIDKLDMFTNIINSRLKFKEIRISRTHGIVAFKTNTNEQLNIKSFSSGEKQLIVLFYELIFETKNGTLLLIDEPEISLHIEWQLKFMDDLLKISKNKKFKIIVATHSPQIINNHWDIQIDLGEIYGG